MAERNARATKVVRDSVPLRRQTTQILREAIENLEFVPGQRLVERELCEMTDVSRTLIREALRELESEGYVKIVAYRGPVVAAPFTVEEARPIYETRAVLEALAGYSFAQRADDEQVAALREQLERAERNLRQPTTTMGERVQVKADFYGELLRGAGNEVLTAMLRGIHGRISALRAITLAQPGRPEESLAELGEIVRAVERRDPDAAWRACKAHVDSAAEVAYRLLGAAGDGSGANPYRDLRPRT